MQFEIVFLNTDKSDTVALAVYEYTITVGREIQLVWKRPKTGSVWLFLATRYLMILSFVPQIIPVASSVSYIQLCAHEKQR